MIDLPNPFSLVSTAARPSIVCLRCGREHGCICSHRNQYIFDAIDFAQRFKTLTEHQIEEINRREDLVPISIHWAETTLRRMWDEDIARTAEAVPGFERLTCHSCRHGFATKMLRDKVVDPKTAASLGGWADIGLFMKTYAHAMEDATLTEGLFDTPVARDDGSVQQNQEVKKK